MAHLSPTSLSWLLLLFLLPFCFDICVFLLSVGGDLILILEKSLEVWGPCKVLTASLPPCKSFAVIPKRVRGCWWGAKTVNLSLLLPSQHMLQRYQSCILLFFEPKIRQATLSASSCNPNSLSHFLLFYFIGF